MHYWQILVSFLGSSLVHNSFCEKQNFSIYYESSIILSVTNQHSSMHHASLSINFVKNQQDLPIFFAYDSFIYLPFNRCFYSILRIFNFIVFIDFVFLSNACSSDEMALSQEDNFKTSSNLSVSFLELSVLLFTMAPVWMA